jgi:hypothetical protein
LKSTLWAKRPTFLYSDPYYLAVPKETENRYREAFLVDSLVKELKLQPSALENNARLQRGQ